MRAFLTASILVVVIAVPASGIAAERVHRSNPYANLFTQQFGDPQVTPAPPVPAPAVPFIALGTPRSYSYPPQAVVCGLTVVQGDSKIDRAMPHRPAANAPTPSIKVFPAPACQK